VLRARLQVRTCPRRDRRRPGRSWRNSASHRALRSGPTALSDASSALVSPVQSLFALARSRWCAPHGNVPRCSTFPRGARRHTLATFSIARVAPVRRAPCGLASDPAVLGPPANDLGHATLAGRRGSGDRCDGLRERGSRPVAPAGWLGQIDRYSGRRRAAGWSRAGPGQDESVLALEKAVAADTTGPAPLGRIVLVGRDLERAAERARQGAAGAGDRDDTRRCIRVDCAEVDHPLPAVDADAGHAARGAPLRAYMLSRVTEELCVAGHEDQVFPAGPEFGGSADPLAVAQTNDFPRILVLRKLGHHPLDHAGGRAERDPS